jgi:hypothetical protein
MGKMHCYRQPYDYVTSQAPRFVSLWGDVRWPRPA